MKNISPEEFDYIATMTKNVINGDTVWSSETGHVTVRSCQNYMYDFNDEELIVACTIDGLFTPEEMATCLKLGRSADELRSEMEAANADLFTSGNTEAFVLHSSIATKTAILYFATMYMKELAEETSKAA